MKNINFQRINKADPAWPLLVLRIGFLISLAPLVVVIAGCITAPVLTATSLPYALVWPAYLGSTLLGMRLSRGRLKVRQSPQGIICGGPHVVKRLGYVAVAVLFGIAFLSLHEVPTLGRTLHMARAQARLMIWALISLDFSFGPVYVMWPVGLIVLSVALLLRLFGVSKVVLSGEGISFPKHFGLNKDSIAWEDLRAIYRENGLYVLSTVRGRHQIDLYRLASDPELVADWIMFYALHPEKRVELSGSAAIQRVRSEGIPRRPVPTRRPDRPFHLNTLLDPAVREPRPIALTGGIASGKSFVARKFAELGAVIVDFDEVAREVVQPGTPGLAAVVRRFGDVLQADGNLDRGKLAGIIFSDDRAREDLNSILHPHIRERAWQLVEEAGSAAMVIQVIPLLVEADLVNQFKTIIVVDLPEEQQLQRLQAREGISAEEAERRIAAQADRATRRVEADVVIDNSGDEAATALQVARVWRLLQRAATVTS